MIIVIITKTIKFIKVASIHKTLAQFCVNTTAEMSATAVGQGTDLVHKYKRNFFFDSMEDKAAG